MNWREAFPDVFSGDEPGFDCVIGNPPWERMKLQEREFFALSAPDIGYSPPTMIEAGGARQLIVWTPEGVNSLNPEDGTVYWSKNLKPNYNMSVMAPQKYEDKLYAGGMGRVGALYQLAADEPGAEVLWTGKPKTAVYACNSTPLIVDGTIYGVDIETSQLMAVSMEGGERLWTTTGPTAGEEGSRVRHGTASLTYHEPSGNFWLFNERGELIVAELSPEGYLEKGRAQVLEPTNEAFGRAVVWTVPAFAMKSAFVRNDEELVRVELGE